MKAPPGIQRGDKDFGILMVALCMTIGTLIAFNREPNYHARSLNSWFKDLAAIDPYQRELAKDAIREIGADALPYVIKTLESADTHGRACALVAVEALGQDARPAMPILITLLRADQSSTAAARALAAIGPAAAPSLGKELSSPVNFVRYNAAFALGLMRSSARAAVPDLIRALSDRDERLRYQAARALGQIEEEPALSVPALAGCLSDTSVEVRENAARSLGRFHRNARSAMPALQKALVVDDPRVQETIVIALREIDHDFAAKTDAQ